jgi:hypothetical protein
MVPHAGFRAGIGNEFKSKAVLIVQCRLPGIANIKFNMVRAVYGQKILLHPAVI